MGSRRRCKSPMWASARSRASACCLAEPDTCRSTAIPTAGSNVETPVALRLDSHPSPCLSTGAASHLELPARVWPLLIDAAETRGTDDSSKSGTDFRYIGIQLRPQPRQKFRRVSALPLEDHRQSRKCESNRFTIVQSHVGLTAVRRGAASAAGLAIAFSIHDGTDEDRCDQLKPRPGGC